MPGQFKLLGNSNDLIILGELRISREPWPLFDVSGSVIEFNGIVTVSSGVHILTHDHHFHKKNWRDMEKILSVKPTVICEFSFIGINAIIMPTCKYIGKHSVIAAGAIITKDVPDCEIWAGNPAIKIGDVI